MKQHWYAVMTLTCNDCYWQGPSLVTIRGDTIYWRGGPSRMHIHDMDGTVKILKDYGEIESGDEDTIDQLYDQFDHDFPPEKELKVSAGWLAPNGDFYPCRYTEHLDVAQHIAFVTYGERGDGAQRLENEKWAKVGTTGYVTTHDYTATYTKKQLETMMALVVLAKEDRETYALTMAEEVRNASTY